MVEWRVYGCGSASSSRSLQSSYEFVHRHTRLQIDFGNGAVYQRCRHEGDIRTVLDAVSHIVITHGHHDHTVDLARHIVAWKYTPGYSPGRPVHMYLTEESRHEIQQLIDSSGFKGIFDEIYIPHHIRPNEPFSINDLLIHPFAVEHKAGTIGIRIETPEGIQVTFTGDTRAFPELSRQFLKQDLLVTEASFLENTHPMHLNLQEAATLAADSRSKNLLLVHFYPEMEAKTEEEIRTAAARWYDGNVFCAHDGLALKYNPEDGRWQRSSLF